MQEYIVDEDVMIRLSNAIKNKTGNMSKMNMSEMISALDNCNSVDYGNNYPLITTYQNEGYAKQLVALGNQYSSPPLTTSDFSTDMSLPEISNKTTIYGWGFGELFPLYDGASHDIVAIKTFAWFIPDDIKGIFDAAINVKLMDLSKFDCSKCTSNSLDLSKNKKIETLVLNPSILNVSLNSNISHIINTETNKRYTVSEFLDYTSKKRRYVEEYKISI